MISLGCTWLVSFWLECWGRRDSFAAKCIDRGEAGGTAGGIDAEGDADADGDHDGSDGGHRRDGDLVGDEVRKDRGTEEAQPGTEDAADGAEHRRLHQELTADDAGGGAERLAQPDLSDPLGHRAVS